MQSYFEQGRRTAQAIGDEHLRGLCLMNRVEVMIALRRYDAAQLAAETALSIFEEIHAPAGIADVVRLLGVVHRETGRLGQAKSRLDMAVELARETESPVSYGEALREAAILECRLGDLDLAVDRLSRACQEFSRVPIGLETAEVARGEYPKFVPSWGELLRSLCPEAADHGDRVAGLASAVAEAMGLPVEDRAVIRVAGQLHEVGLLRLPRHVATATRPLGGEDERLYRSHAAVGAKVLASAPCFGRVAPIVAGLASRDGTGDASTAIAILRLVDAYDHLVSGHGPTPVIVHSEALARLAAPASPLVDRVHQALAAVTGPSR